MPEIPDLTVYIEHLDDRVVGRRLSGIRIASPFLLRSVSPTVDEVAGREVVGVRRLAKQIVLELTEELFVVMHLMIAGRLRWYDEHKAIPKRNGLAAFDFDNGSLILTEASRKRRASLRLVRGPVALADLDPGGMEVCDIEFEAFFERLQSTPHTVKRALTDQRVFAGIGNAYSDEILFEARMSPFKLGRNMTTQEARKLFDACRDVLARWTDTLRSETGGKFPAKVTAFHPQMAVHGKYREPCVVCGAPVQRILKSENESNYCARCQTGGRLLADRSLSRLLKDTYPKRIEDLEGP
ncbi:MAG: formamidopyrimidine-DNA glycosylase [Gammaproteobacteria bacterium]|nr:formamidopyrimidine-DNA glycosylase [Gammaproteobacteria bacterium]MYF29954.1 formamidopyrimidine-DNA glycosylase [Gammaproteobacteria bacterium]MYK48545.1 formamidopyrimidine-DNA glycosylase [Gammaproteobacteria bacterium]